MDINATDHFWHFFFAESCVLLGNNVRLSAKEVQSVNCRLDKATKAWLAEASVRRRGNTRAALLQLESKNGRVRRRR